MARTLLLLAACIVASRCIENIDLQQPIVRLPPSQLNAEGYFGYSLVFHQKQFATEFRESLDNTYIIVGAPNGTLLNSATNNTGFVYECPITRNGVCTPIDTVSDDSANGDLEDKQGQFMGGALASNGDRFIACGHRYVNYNRRNTNERSVYGRCFISDRSLEDFNEFQPCDGFGRRLSESAGVCQAGMSATVALDRNDRSHVAVGAPGTYLWRGIVIRTTPTISRSTVYQPIELNGENVFGWQGYSITKGYFQSMNVEDFATSVPRLGSYFGAVHIVENNNDLQLVSQNLVGEQMGEYYGFSLAALDLAGDGLHELLVSAPMFRDRNIGAETGRVYVYRNIGGTLSEAARLVGPKAYGRFGHAMVSLGDITGDGFDDVAISAPFGEGQGTVFIYHSSASQTLLNPTPQQIITPSDLNLVSSIMNRIMTFGTSLASFDVDGNNFDDLAIGSYYDQTVVILRTLPQADVVTTLRATPGIVNLNDTGSQALYNGEMLTFFTVSLTIAYNGEGNINVTLSADRARLRQGLVRRIFFDDEADRRPTTISRRLQQLEQPFTIKVFVENDIADFLTGFVIDLDVTADRFTQGSTNGNVNPVDLRTFPVVSINGPNSAQVEILNDCDSVCISDLSVRQSGPAVYQINESFALEILTVGLVNNIIVPLVIKNNASNAFLAQMTFSLPIQQLTFVGISDPVITCNPGNGNGQQIPYICDLGNPFRNFTERNVNLIFAPSDSLTGAEGNIFLAFNVTSLNENTSRLDDNQARVTLMVNTEANIFVNRPVVDPDQVNHAPFSPMGQIENVTQLGADFTTTFTVGNSGPSIIPTAQITIHWPLRVLNSESDLYFLYPIGWRVIQSTSVSVSCDNTYFNPENFDLAAEEDSNESPDDLLLLPGGGGRRRRNLGGARKPRRRRRSIRLRRQDMMNGPSNENMVDCRADQRDNPDNAHSCAAIVCTINQLRARDRVQIEISAHIDERHLGGNADTFVFFPSAEVETIGADHITEGNQDDNTAHVEFRSVPMGGGGGTTPGEREGDGGSFPWYAVVAPIIAAVILVIVAAVVLYFCGFFRRKNKDELEEQARENLAEADGGTSGNYTET